MARQRNLHWRYAPWRFVAWTTAEDAIVMAKDDSTDRDKARRLTKRTVKAIQQRRSRINEEKKAAAQ